MANVDNKKLKGGARSSFVERAEKTLDEYNLGSSVHNSLDSKVLDRKLKENGRNLIERERKNTNVFFS